MDHTTFEATMAYYNYRELHQMGAFRRSPGEWVKAMVPSHRADTPLDVRCLPDSPVRCMILVLKGRIDSWLEADVGRADLAGAAHLQLISGVVQLRPEDAVLEAMLRGWRAQQTARGLREEPSRRGSG